MWQFSLNLFAWLREFLIIITRMCSLMYSEAGTVIVPSFRP